MQSTIHFIDELLGNIGNFLRGISYANYFLLVPLALLVVLCTARLISNIMTVISPGVFGHDHRKALYKNSRICFIFSIIIQLLYWLWGSETQRNLLCHADYLAACILAGTAILGLLAGSLQMIIRRKGTRVFTMRSLSTSGLTLLVMAAVLAVWGWLFLS